MYSMLGVAQNSRIKYSKDTILVLTSQLLQTHQLKIESTSIFQPSISKNDTAVVPINIINDLDSNFAIYLCTYSSNNADFYFTNGLKSETLNIGVRHLKKDPSRLVNSMFFDSLHMEKCGEINGKLKVYNSEFFGAIPVYFYDLENLELNYNYGSQYYSVSGIVQNIFIGVIFFNFLHFLLLYYFSKRSLYFWYISYVLFQIIYWFAIMNTNNFIGSIWNDKIIYQTLLSEPAVFIGQIFYLILIEEWLQLQKNKSKVFWYTTFAKAVFAVYVLLFISFYIFDLNDDVLYGLYKYVRILSVFIQISFVTILLFSNKAFGKKYIIFGTSLVTIFGVLIPLITSRYAFDTSSPLSFISSGSWYLIGILGECLVFSIGIGSYYSYLQSQSLILQKQKIKNLENQFISEEIKLREKIKISDELQDKIGSTLSSISVYSKLAKDAEFNPATNQMDLILTKISDTSVNMVSEMNDLVWTINPKNDSFAMLIKRMESHLLQIASLNSIPASFKITPEINAIQPSMETRKNIYLDFQKIIHLLSIKYQPKKIDISIDFPIDLIRINIYFLGLKEIVTSQELEIVLLLKFMAKSQYKILEPENGFEIIFDYHPQNIA